MKTIKVKTNSKNYDIKVGNDLLESIPISKLVSGKDVLLIIDNKIPELLINKFKKNLKKSSAKKISLIKIRAAEGNKNMSYIMKIYDYLIKNNYSRDCIVFGFGGGITCDIMAKLSANPQG